MKERIYKVVKEIFKTENINDDMNEDDFEEWDSLGHFSLILGLEEEFKIKFSPIEILKIEEIGDIIKIIEKKVQS